MSPLRFKFPLELNSHHHVVDERDGRDVWLQHSREQLFVPWEPQPGPQPVCTSSFKDSCWLLSQGCIPQAPAQGVPGDKSQVPAGDQIVLRAGDF